jgi:hypothetical protein
MPKTKTKLIEMYIGNTDRTWTTDYIEIPQDTPDEKLVEVCETTALNQFEAENLSFVGIYSIPEEENEDEENN